ncbi:MAG: Bacterial regulatory protein Fis family [Verrucomicrobiota bacterium]|jgi:DNA-binding protein Fis
MSPPPKSPRVAQNNNTPANLVAAEHVLVARAMALTSNNISQAARLLGVNRTSLYRWQEHETRQADPIAS